VEDDRWDASHGRAIPYSVGAGTAAVALAAEVETLKRDIYDLNEQLLDRAQENHP
jgi:hypothetical protein